MRIKADYQLQKIDEQWVIVHNGVSTGKVINSIVLNDSTVFLWNLLKEKELSKTEMLEALINQFDISTVLALGNIDVFVRTLRENGIIEE